jgi:LysR family hydrogen peroxide-inducible transcriptional activator
MFCNSTYFEHANSKIEEELSIQIFDRTKRIQLTDIGHKIKTSKNIVNEADHSRYSRTAKGFIGGEFRLGIIPTIMPTLLPIPKFH